MSFDFQNTPTKTDAEKLFRFLDLIEDRRPLYRQEELGAILRHQMATRVEFDLGNMDPGIQRLLRAAGVGGSTGSIRTFGDLFRHPAPPLPLLHLTKNFAKRHLSHPESPLPPEIASVLYYSCLAAGLVRYQQRITVLSDQDLRQGLRRILRQDWLDDETRSLLERALSLLLSSSPMQDDFRLET